MSLSIGGHEQSHYTERRNTPELNSRLEAIAIRLEAKTPDSNFVKPQLFRFELRLFPRFTQRIAYPLQIGSKWT